MASKSFVRKGELLTWDFTEPRRSNTSRDSPVFEFMNSKWMLKFHLFRDQRSLAGHYSIILINCNGTNSFDPFEVATTLEYRRNGKQLKCSHLTVRSSYATLWVEKRETIKEKMEFCYDRIGTPIDLAVMCVFYSIKKHSCMIEKVEKSIQVSTKCSGCQKRSYSFLGKAASQYSAEISETVVMPLSHLENLSKDISGMLNRSHMADVQLKCGEVLIPAHRAILAARSEVFSSMFENKMLEHNSGIVNIEDMEPSILQEFLKYLYSGKLSDDLSATTVRELYITSCKYAVHYLRRECAILMAKNLNRGNFTECLMVSEIYADQVLKDAIANFITENPHLVKCDCWMTFSDQFPKIANQIYQKYMEKTLQEQK